MKPTTIRLDARLERQLRAVARREGRPVEAVARDAIARYVRQHRRRSDASSPTAAVRRRGHRETAARIEDLLWRDLLPRSPRRLGAMPVAPRSGRLTGRRGA